MVETEEDNQGLTVVIFLVVCGRPWSALPSSYHLSGHPKLPATQRPQRTLTTLPHQELDPRVSTAHLYLSIRNSNKRIITMNSFITEVMTEVNKVGLAKNNTKKVPDYMLAIVEVLVIKISANNSKSEEQNAKIDLLNAKIDELIAKHASEIKVRDDKSVIQENIVSYLKDEVKSLGVNKLKLEKDINSRDEMISQLDRNMTKQQYHTDNIGQYNRRDNVKITGVPLR